MNTQQQFLFVVSLLLILPSHADEKSSTPNAFPPSDFSVEKSTEANTQNVVAPTQDASGKSTNPWGGKAIPVKAEKQYPVMTNKGALPPYNRPPNFQQPNFQVPPMSGKFPPVGLPARNMGYQMPNTSFSNISPFGNSFSPNSFFNNGAMPTPWSNVGGVNPWRNNNNSVLPPFFPNTVNTGKKKSWGDIRHIWPDFYTDFTDEIWDKSINAPYDMGRMPGGWRAPSLSSPDPVTVGDAVTNQFPPMLEEMGNMMNFAN